MTPSVLINNEVDCETACSQRFMNISFADDLSPGSDPGIDQRFTLRAPAS